MSVKALRCGAFLFISVLAVSLKTSCAQSECSVGELWATYVTQNKLTVNWNKNPGCVYKYNVCLRAAGGIREQCETLYNFFIQWSASSLQPCTNYTINVAAVGTDGARGPNATLDVVTAPDPVIGVDVVERSDDYLIVDWSPASSTCARQYAVTWCALVDYGSSCRAAGAANMSAGSTELRLDGLEACTSYRVSVSAQGGQGASDAVRTTGSTSSVGLSPVTGLSVSLREMGKWQLNWDVPSKGVNCIDYYYVCTEMSGDSTIHCGVSYNNSLSSKVQHPCQDYTANVSMRLRSGGFSDNATISFQTRPGDPTSPEANATATTISLEWRRSYNNDSCVASYLVSWCQSAYPEDCDAEHRASVAFDPNNTRHAIEGLESCTLYPVAVEAVSRAGEQSEPATISVRTKVDVAPGAVRNLRTTRVTADIISVAWQQPSNFKCVSGYSACVRRTADSAGEACEDLPAARVRWSTSSALEPSTSYTVVVAPVDYDGNRGANASVSVLARRAPSP
ncbi:collagen alpha-1(XIV) chain-like [Bacillus rossius redtenbacheri]|uniref:collagen alpha-1(XIV) chain-like n=1 Tax=Bacillus rossius redtenbacheri TaxID=93214 RepID=UPI002FDE0860